MFPPPVKAVAIPKKSGGERILGVPTVSDRVAQMVVKMVLEPVLEPVFLPDSYGYRPEKSALDAVAIVRSSSASCGSAPLTRREPGPGSCAELREPGLGCESERLPLTVNVRLREKFKW